MKSKMDRAFAPQPEVPLFVASWPLLKSQDVHSSWPLECSTLPKFNGDGIGFGGRKWGKGQDAKK